MLSASGVQKYYRSFISQRLMTQNPNIFQTLWGTIAFTLSATYAN